MANLRDDVAVIRALRRGPATIVQLAEWTGLSTSAVYRTIRALIDADAPIIEQSIDTGESGRPAKTFAITGRGIAKWLE